MKFKAVWKPECSQCAYLFISALKDSSAGLLGGKATIHFSHNKCILTSLCKRRDESEAWIELDPSNAFSSFVCESLRNNCIDLAISCPALLLVFKYICVYE